VRGADTQTTDTENENTATNRTNTKLNSKSSLKPTHVRMCCCRLLCLCAPGKLEAYAAIASQTMLQALASSHFIKLLNQL